MIAIDDTLVSDYLKTITFCCDLPNCLGSCCVEGDAGAPLEPEEATQISEHLESLIAFMTLEGVQWVENFGVTDIDPSGNVVTPLLEGKECAYAFFEGEVAKCAMEKAWEEGVFPFQKPISCHLFPVRVRKYKLSEAVNYQEWHVCQPALIKGRNEEIPLYIFLKESLVRKYGEAWYSRLTGLIDAKKP